MARRPTILDVAKVANVSKSTVSLVLQGSPSVKEETRQTVRRAMAEIGYVYNRSAATLRSAASGLIGLVINDIRNPFFTEFAASLQMKLAEQGYATVIANTDENPDLQHKTISSLAEHGVSGLVISPAYGDEARMLAALDAAPMPVMQVFRRLDVDAPRFPFIAPDYVQGSRLATRHLLAQGCRRIAFLGGLDGRFVTQERMQGYLTELSQHGLSPITMTGQATRGFGKSAIAALRAQHRDLDGVLCFNDLVALGVLSACAEHGPKVGPELAVVGIDDIEGCQDSFPPLTSVSCNTTAQAELTADHLLSWIKTGTRPTDTLRLPVSLVPRASTWRGASQHQG